MLVGYTIFTVAFSAILLQGQAPPILAWIIPVSVLVPVVFCYCTPCLKCGKRLGWFALLYMHSRPEISSRICPHCGTSIYQPVAHPSVHW